MKAILACYLLLSGLIWLISPLLISHYISPFLATKNLILDDKSTIRYNPFMTSITLSDISVSTSDNTTEQPLLMLNSAKIELSFWRLLTRVVYLSQIDIEGLTLNISKSATEINIAGLNIPSTSSDNANNEAGDKSILDDYTLKIPSMNITNSLLQLDWFGNKHTIGLTALDLNRLYLNAQQQQGKIVLSLTLNNSPVNLDAKIDLKKLEGDIDYSLGIQKLDLKNFNHFIFNQELKSSDQISGLISLDYQQEIEIDRSIIKTKINNADLEFNNLFAQIQSANLSVAEQKLLSKELQINIENWSVSPEIYVSGKASYLLKKLNAYTKENYLSLANVNALAIPEIAFETQSGKHQIHFPEIKVEQADFSDDQNDGIPPLAHFKSMDIFNMQLSEDGLSINSIDILGFGVDIKIIENAELAGLIKLSDDDQENINNVSEAETTELKDSVKSQVENASSETFPVAINEIKLIDSSQINIIDESVEPAIERHFYINHLLVGPFDNQKPNQLSVLTMDGTSNKYAFFNFKVESKPFSATPYYKLSGLFKEVNLPAISTYIKDALGYEFDSGQLDLDIDVIVDNTDVNGTTKIGLRGVKLGAANNPTDETLTSSSSIPFNYALSMLKDGDGNVELDVPLKGSTTDPDFSIQGFVALLIKRATMVAAKQYVITMFIPFANILTVSLFSSEYLLKVSFNDLPLTTGVAEVPEAALPFLEQLSTFMIEKEGTDITVCAFAIPQDIGIESSVIKFSEVQHKQLKDLSLERMYAFKNHMVKEQGIESSRLLLCSPKVDRSENAQARLTFTG
jgi:hypothetical protein